MIHIVHGNLLESDAEALVNTVNCVGIMGKGIALQFKKAYPENFKAYEKACKDNKVEIGKMFVCNTGQIINPKFIINFPTKKHWKAPSHMEYLKAGLRDFIAVIKNNNIKSVAMPPLGCGNGGLPWETVRQLISDTLTAELPEVDIVLFAPDGAPTIQTNVQPRHLSLTVFKATIIKLIDRYICWDDKIRRIEIQKLCYFQKEAKDPNFASLAFKKMTYGPYANALGHAIHDMDGQFLYNCGDSEDPLRRIWLAPDAAEKASAFILNTSSDTDKYLARVFDLINGFETPIGMELLSSVHWAAVNTPNPAQNEDDAFNYIQSWNSRKATLFKKYHIHVAWEQLKSMGWI